MILNRIMTDNRITMMCDLKMFWIVYQVASITTGHLYISHKYIFSDKHKPIYCIASWKRCKDEKYVLQFCLCRYYGILYREVCRWYTEQYTFACIDWIEQWTVHFGLYRLERMCPFSVNITLTSSRTCLEGFYSHDQWAWPIHDSVKTLHGNKSHITQ